MPHIICEPRDSDVHCRSLASVELACGDSAQAVVNGACMSRTVADMSHPTCFWAAAVLLEMSQERSDRLYEYMGSMHGNCTQATTMVCLDSRPLECAISEPCQAERMYESLGLMLLRYFVDCYGFATDAKLYGAQALMWIHCRYYHTRMVNYIGSTITESV